MTRRLCSFAALALILGLAAWAVPAAHGANGPAETFASEGCGTWSAPAGVTAIHVSAVGAAGGSGDASGGQGDGMSATIPVLSSGETFYVCVDEGGGGGGTGGGGGASGISRGSSFASPLLVAGGGGGGGDGIEEFGEAGGNAGEPVGEAGQSQSQEPISYCETGGLGGNNTTSEGGAGGVGEKGPCAELGVSDASGSVGEASSVGKPGKGGAGAAVGTASGGGGGGGYYGGGGGAAGEWRGKRYAGGGGGGTDYCASSLTCARSAGAGTQPAAGTSSGDAEVAITIEAPVAVVDSPAGGETYRTGESVFTTFSCEEGEGGSGLGSCEDDEGLGLNEDSALGVLSVGPFAGRIIVPKETGEFEYTVTARSHDGQSDTAAIKYKVIKQSQAVNDENDVAVTEANNEVVSSTIATSDVLANDMNLEGDPSTVTKVSDATTPSGVTPVNGAITIDGSYGTLVLQTSGPDSGDYTYSLDHGVVPPKNGATDTFTYTLTDNYGFSSQASLTIALEVTQIVQSQAVNDESEVTVTVSNHKVLSSTAATGNVLTNDLNLESDPSTITEVSDARDPSGVTPVNGVITIDGTYGTLVLKTTGAHAGDYTYALDNAVLPPSGAKDVFSYTLTDEYGLSSTANLTVTLSDIELLKAGLTVCNGTYGGVGTSVQVPAGGTCILVSGAVVKGGVQALKPGGTLIDEGADIKGDVQLRGANGFELDGGGTIGGNLIVTALTGTPVGVDDSLCDTTIHGDVQVLDNSSRSPLDIGTPGDCNGGPGLKVGGLMQVQGNRAGVAVAGNTLGGSLQVAENKSKLSIDDNTVGGSVHVYSNSGDLGSTLRGNSAGQACKLYGNSPPISGSENVTRGGYTNLCNRSA